MDPILGQIMIVGFNFAPRGWAFCDGQLLSISSNTALFSLLGTTFGGNGQTTFGLPDLRGRCVYHVGTGSGLKTTSWGERGGRNNVSLTSQNLPPHNHGLTSGSFSIGYNEERASTSGSVLASPPLNTEAAENTISGTLTGNTQNTGSGLSFDIDSPFLGMYVCIALQGIYPSRS